MELAEFVAGILAALQNPVAGAPPELPPPPDPSLDPGNPEQAVLIHWLITHQNDWMVRRVENFQLVDDRTVVRQTSFDFQLPQEIEGSAVFPTLRVVPLTTLAKAKLTAFDLRDECGQALPLLDTRDRSVAAATALIALAESVLDRPVAGETRQLLENVGRMPAPAASQEHERMRTGTMPNGNPARAALVAEWRKLVDAPVMERLLSQLAREFILLTPLLEPVGRRRVLKMSYQETYEPLDLGAWTWLAVRLGWAPVTIEFVTGATGRCRSYHAELAAPDNSELLLLAVFDGRDPPKWDFEPRDRPLARGTMNVQLEDGDSEREGQVFAMLRGRRSGFLLPSVLTCGLTFALLLASRFQLREVSSVVEAGSALLLIVPALMAAYLLRPGEHALVTTMVRGVRVMVVASAGCAVSAAALLVLKLRPPWLHFLWTGLLFVSLLMFLGTLVSFIRPRSAY